MHDVNNNNSNNKYIYIHTGIQYTIIYTYISCRIDLICRNLPHICFYMFLLDFHTFSILNDSQCLGSFWILPSLGAKLADGAIPVFSHEASPLGAAAAAGLAEKSTMAELELKTPQSIESIAKWWSIWKAWKAWKLFLGTEREDTKRRER